MIGIVGGVGPFAGVDLLQKILSQTAAQSDQDHLTILSLSQPAAVPDRTAFLLGQEAANPARPLLEQLLRLEQAGAQVAGIPCNTAHAPAIMDQITAELAARGSKLRLLNMIDEAGLLLREHYGSVRTLGVLGTTGTIVSRTYPLALEPLGYEVLQPDERVMEQFVQPAIYDRAYGIKANGYVTRRAYQDILTAIDHLSARGAEAIILGCTELPLAFDRPQANNPPLIDSTLALARALIREIAPEKLRPWADYSAG